MKATIPEGVRQLIIEYFKIDPLSKEPLTKDTRENILQTFKYCYANHMSIGQVVHQLKHSNLSELRDRIIKRMESNYNPFPIRLGDLKPHLQMEAMDHNKSLHGYILSILRERDERQQNYLDMFCVPRLNKMYRFKRLRGAESYLQLGFGF